MTPEIVAIVVIGFLLGGILKGATGAGAPTIAVPLLAAAVDLRFAIVVFAIPNVVPNIWQAWAYRKTLLPMGFIARFVLSGMVGGIAGTWALAKARPDWLVLVLAAAVAAFIALRLARPHWVLRFPLALKLSPLAGFVAGALQTAAGLSAPVSITFLNAMRLERETFMPSISCFFAGLGVVQIPLLVGYGLMDGPRALLSAASLVPLIAGMPIGAWLGRRMSRRAFDWIILTLLAVLAVRLVWGVFG